MAGDGQVDGGPSAVSLDQEVEQWELDSLSDTDSSAASSLRSSPSAPSDGAGGVGDDQADEVEQVELDSLSDDSSVADGGSEQLSRLRCESSSGSSLVEKADLDSSDEDEELDSGAASQPERQQAVHPAAEQRQEPGGAAAAAELPLLAQPAGPASPAAGASLQADDGAADWGEQLESIQTPAREGAWADASLPQSPQPPPLQALLEDAPIGQRTRARAPLPHVTIEELEALLQDDLPDSDAEDDRAYQEFLQALQGGEPPLLLEEGDDADDADWMLDLEELLDAGEEGWLDAPPPPSPLRTRHTRAAGLLDGPRAGQPATWVPQEPAGAAAGAGPLAECQPGQRTRRQASKRLRPDESGAAAAAGQQQRAAAAAAVAAAASEGLAALARSQADAIMRQRQLREQYRDWKRKERRRSVLKAQRRRQRAAQGLTPEEARPAAAAATAAPAGAAAPGAAAGAAAAEQRGASQPGRVAAAAAAAPPPLRLQPRPTGAAAVQQPGLLPLVSGPLAVAIPWQLQPPPAAGAGQAAWAPEQLAHLRTQVGAHLQLLCHVLSLLAGGGAPKQLAQCRAMLLHMATVCVQSLGVAELAQQQPPAARSVLAAPVLPHIVPLVTAVDAACSQPQAAQARAGAGGAPFSLPAVPGGVQQVMAAMGPLLSEELQPQAAALPRGFTPGEVALLRLGLRRVGPDAPLLQRFFLPTKSLENVRGYIRVESDRERASGAGGQARLVLSAAQLAAVRAAVQQQRGGDSVWDGLAAGALWGRTAMEIRDAYWRQGYGVRFASGPGEQQPAAAPTRASAPPRWRAPRAQTAAARGGPAGRSRGRRRGRAAEAAERSGSAGSSGQE